MYCPQCRSEYREGFLMCAECQVELVPSLAGVHEAAREELVPLLETPLPALLGELVDRLEAAGIPYAIQAGTALTLLEGAHAVGRMEPDPWRGIVWVPGGFLDSGRELVAQIRREAAAGREG